MDFLVKTGPPLMKTVPTPPAKSVLISLVLTTAVLAADVRIHERKFLDQEHVIGELQH